MAHPALLLGIAGLSTVGIGSWQTSRALDTEDLKAKVLGTPMGITVPIAGLAAAWILGGPVALALGIGAAAGSILSSGDTRMVRTGLQNQQAQAALTTTPGAPALPGPTPGAPASVTDLVKQLLPQAAQ